MPPEYGNDPAIDAAAAKLMGRFTGAPVETEPKKRSPELRDPPTTTQPARPVQAQQDEEEVDEGLDVNGYETDPELVEGAEAQEAEAEGEEAQESQDDYFELPGETEGAKAEKIPRTEAIEAVRKMRQLNGSIAEAITKAETEHYAKQDTAWTNMVQAHNTIIDRAEAALASIPQPRMPPMSMLDERSADYDPQRYYALASHYDNQVKILEHVKRQKAEAEEGLKLTRQAAQADHLAREHERTARYIPDWKDDAKRKTISEGIYSFLDKSYGLPATFLDNIPFDHRIIRVITDLQRMTEAQAKTPEVRRAVQDAVPKLNGKGRIPSQDRAPNGQFINEAKKRLKTEKSEEAAAAKWIKDGTIAF